ncbi:MAG: hypothetical protein HY930_04160 [Euryarchaeota archaeon]|nr:hypothetical protein [Euryarchaeota archaeon]
MKFLYMFLAAALLTLPSSFADTVVLVSSSPADKAVAEIFGERIGAKIIVTEWGILSETAVRELILSNKTKVYIIGGHTAIPSLVEDVLALSGTQAKRLWGYTRYETAAAVAEEGWKSPKAAVIAHGYDELGIKNAKERAKAVGAPLLYASDTYISEKVLSAIEKLGAKEMTLIAWPGIWRERIKEEIEIKQEVEYNKEQSAETIKKAQEAVQRGKSKLVDYYAISRAEKEIIKAEEAFSGGKYGKAFRTAAAARSSIEASEMYLERYKESEEEGEVKKGKSVSAVKHFLIAIKITGNTNSMLSKGKLIDANVSEELQLLSDARTKLAEAEKYLAVGEENKVGEAAKEAMKMSLKAEESYLEKMRAGVPKMIPPPKY